MNKKIISLMCITCIYSSTMVAVHELRTPLSLTSKLNPINGSFHYPIKYVDDEKTNVDLWGGAYYRQACKGFCPKVCDWCCNSCCDNCVTYACDSVCNSCNPGVSSCSAGCCSNNSLCAVNTNYIGCFDCCGKRVPLAKLFFGKKAFYGEEAFAPESFDLDSVMSTIPLRPSIDYCEKGVVLGIHFERKVKDKNWRVGFNAALPIKKIEVEADLSCDSCCTVVTEGENGALIDLTDRAIYRLEYLPDVDGQDFGITALGETFAFRLDLLEDLEVIEYPLGGSIKVAGIDLGVRDQSTSANSSEDVFPAVAYRPKNDDVDLVVLDLQDLASGYREPKSLSIRNPRASSTDPTNTMQDLIADGTIPLNPAQAGNPTPVETDRRRYYRYINNGTVYDVTEANKEKVFIIPAFARNTGSNNNMYTAGAMTIKNKVDQLIRELQQEGEQPKKGPELLLAEYGVCLVDKTCVTGLGDLDTSIFVAHDFTDRAFAEVVLGLRLPTGKKNLCPGKIYRIPTGNNGHFEAKIGVDGGWRSKRWFGIHAEAYYAHVLEAVEKRAAQFKGATIRGIGPCVDAKVKWGYFVGHLDLTVFHPENQKMGFALGYELYYKRHDKVQLCGACLGDRAEDFLGNIVKLDSSLLEVNTNILAHKVRGQVYHRWNYFELYAGASRVVGGWNCMLENEVHIGFGINF